MKDNDVGNESWVITSEVYLKHDCAQTARKSNQEKEVPYVSNNQIHYHLADLKSRRG